MLKTILINENPPQTCRKAIIRASKLFLPLAFFEAFGVLVTVFNLIERSKYFFSPFDESCQHLNLSEEKKAEFHSVKASADVNAVVADISLSSNLTKKTFEIKLSLKYQQPQQLDTFKESSHC